MPNAGFYGASRRFSCCFEPETPLSAPAGRRLTTFPPFAYNKPSHLRAGLPAIAPVGGDSTNNTRGIDERARSLAVYGSRSAVERG
jgi:hypothetical protein